MENAAHNVRCFIVHQPVVFFIRVLLEPIGNRVGDRLAGLTPYLILCFLLAAAIAHVPLAHNVDERGKLPCTLVLAVHTIRDSNEPNAMLSEKNLGIKTRLQIVTPDTAHILGDHTADLPGLNVRHKLFPTGPLEVSPAPSVIRVMGNVGKTPLSGIAFKHSLLIHD